MSFLLLLRTGALKSGFLKWRAALSSEAVTGAHVTSCDRCHGTLQIPHKNVEMCLKVFSVNKERLPKSYF